MADKIQDPSEPLDYRYGGETWDSWALKYMQTIPYIFRVLNAINGTGEDDFVLPSPEGAGALVRKNANGTVSINIIGNASTATRANKADTCTGNASTATRWITPRKITLKGDVSGSCTLDGSSDVLLNVKCTDGNATSIIGRSVDDSDIADGAILVYREKYNRFVLEPKDSIGVKRDLFLVRGDGVLWSFSGDAVAYISTNDQTLYPIKAEGAKFRLDVLTVFNVYAQDVNISYGANSNVFLEDVVTSYGAGTDFYANIRNVRNPNTVEEYNVYYEASE